MLETKIPRERERVLVPSHGAPLKNQPLIQCCRSKSPDRSFRESAATVVRMCGYSDMSN